MIWKIANQFVANNIVKESGTVRESTFYDVGGVAVELVKLDRKFKLFCRCDYGKEENICSHKVAVILFKANKVNNNG